MAQMNPLIGPQLHQNILLIIGREWGDGIKDAGSYKAPAHVEDH